MNYKKWIILTILLFLSGLILGISTPDSIISLFAGDEATLQEFADLLTPLPQSTLFVFIFLKNVSALTITFVLSPIFCLAPVLSLFTNGWLLGIVSNTVIQEKSIGFLLAGILPHGIFELPALFIGQAVALSFGTAVMLAIFNREKRGLLRASFITNLKYLSIAITLLLPAAIIETYITPLFLT